MLITKDAAQIAIMRSLGFSLHNVRVQYLTRALLLLTIGLVLGTLFSNTLGQRLVSALWSFMGASQISFVIDPSISSTTETRNMARCSPICSNIPASGLYSSRLEPSGQ
jgi:ABC-type antimicrobial peptide transport system permease subunit